MVAVCPSPLIILSLVDAWESIRKIEKHTNIERFNEEVRHTIESIAFCWMREENKDLKEENKGLKAKIERQDSEIERQDLEIKNLKSENSELRKGCASGAVHLEPSVL